MKQFNAAWWGWKMRAAVAQGVEQALVGSEAAGEFLLSKAQKENETLQGLLRECLTTMTMWADVAPAVSLCEDIQKALTSHDQQASTATENVATGLLDLSCQFCKGSGYVCCNKARGSECCGSPGLCSCQEVLRC